jgi:hypothetical protein
MNPIAPTLTIALLLFAVAASADQLPHRKPGLWQVTMSMQGTSRPPTISQFCIDAQTESALLNKGQSAMKKMCSRHSLSISGNVATMDNTCKFGHSVQTTHSTTTFAGDTAYHSDTRAHYAPALFGKVDMSTIQDGKWMGACPRGMHPGDVLMPGGVKMHMGHAG